MLGSSRYNRGMKRNIGVLVLAGLFMGSAFLAHADDEKELFAKFEKDFSGVKLTGFFTVDGREGQSKEEYTILKVKKLP